MPHARNPPLVLWFDEVGRQDVPLVGGKNASLGEMIRRTRVPVPPGFAVTAYAYQLTIEKAGLVDFVHKQLENLDTHDVAELQKIGASIREAIEKVELPAELQQAITEYYQKLGEKLGERDPDCAIRSSATAEDLPDASFAGQQETYLNVRGLDNIIEATKKCMASLFTNRAISYRVDKGFDHSSVLISVAVQKMVRSDLASSGVIFSIDTESGFRNVVYITGSWGLGEYVVQGKVNPDQFYVFKPTGKLISKRPGSKTIKLVYDEKGGTSQATIPTEQQLKYVITDEEAEQLARYTVEIEKHYGLPMDIEWARDGRTGKLYIVQARPETVHAVKDRTKLRTYVLKEKSNVLIEGEPVGRMIGQGPVNVIQSARDITKFKKGEVLVTEMTDPDWEPIMKIASAIVTNKGGRTCHAAIVSRELGIPCVIGTEHGTEVLKSGLDVTVDCSEGSGRIYEGFLKFEVEEADLSHFPRTKTAIMMNVGIPEKAFDQGQMPNDGVGLARLEFIINSHIQVHPLALLDFENLKLMLQNKNELERVALRHNMTLQQAQLKLEEDLKKIEQVTAGYGDRPQFFVDKLAYGIATIAAAFYPTKSSDRTIGGDVIVRLSDFKSNEYANLIGGWLYEPTESNPMIGYRGCSRYYGGDYSRAFRLECKALRKVRDEMKLTNVKIMFPFCRTVEEADQVIKVLRKEGLERGRNGLELYCMAEIPSNIILADEFAKRFDGFSIGSNDLTQLVLGIDRDSELLAHLFDERNEAVKRSIAQLIKVAHSAKPRVKVGICGQSPSDFEEVRVFLVENEIDSMSLNPDTVIQAYLDVARVEGRPKSSGKRSTQRRSKRRR